ncbi:hypothetical protein HK100_008403 [Physocladia obscura]|uniref:Uncharacterized protein n=1 Tax=Physocladia obscura TaxID=109957 RepID=A0AAD5SNG0_9FUNG|nr:hypothetical protein HK100_008403 [Physocladia obscura]
MIDVIHEPSKVFDLEIPLDRTLRTQNDFTWEKMARLCGVTEVEKEFEENASKNKTEKSIL